MKHLTVNSHLPLLNVGCGDRFDPRWTNVDLLSRSPQVIPWNISAGLPFPDCSFEAVYHSHILEHLDRAEGENLMRECYRVLKPQGHIRVVVPDLEYACRLYLASLDAVRQTPEEAIANEHHEWAVVNLIDQMVRTRSGGEMAEFLGRSDLRDFDFVVDNCGILTRSMRERLLASKTTASTPKSLRVRLSSLLQSDTGKRIRQAVLRFLAPQNTDEILFRETGEIHRWMYDWHSLSALARKVGLSDLRRCGAHESQIAGWASFYLDVDPQGNVRKPESIFLEAVRP